MKILSYFFPILVFLLVSNFVFGQLEFIENKGQWQTGYEFRAKLTHGDFWLSGNKAAFVLSDFGGSRTQHKNHPHTNPETQGNHCYTMEFLGASKSVSLNGQKKKKQYHNYYFSNDQKNWQSSVPLFEEAEHTELYPGINLVWNEEKGNLKYQFEIKAGALPDQIQIEYKGLKSLKMKEGNLVLATSIGTITENKPVAWQIEKGKKVKLECQFQLDNNQKIRFKFPNGYRVNLPIVIDPVLVFSSFSGSRSDNWGFTATYGENGTAYAAGIALGPLFPATIGAFSTVYAGQSNSVLQYATYDISILKFNSTGTQLLYATYLGGAEADSPSSIVVDKDNSLIVLGVTGSSNFPVSASAYDQTFNGGVTISPYGPGESSVQFRTGSDIIISKFSADGSQLFGSTFLGGSANDGIIKLTALGNSPLVRNYGDAFRGEIAVDSSGRIYIASHTESTNFPTQQPLQSTKSTGFDGICARFNPSLSNLEFSTYLGGNGDDGAYSLQVTNESKIFLSGGTTSSNFRTTPGSIKPTFGGNVDGFVCSFIPEQGLSSYKGTFVGTSQYDQSYFVQRDLKGNVYLFGQTLRSYPVTSNAYTNPGSSQFIHCLSANLDTTRFSTVFGSGTLTTNLSPTAFLVDDCGRIYCSGWGGSTNNIPGYQNGNTLNLPTTPGAYSSHSDGSDFYIMVLEKNAQALSFATYFGDTSNNGNGDHVDGGTSRFDKKGIVYQSVCAGCGAQSSFPTTPGVVSNTNQSNNCNNALFKYDFSLLKARYQPSTTQGCVPLVVQFNSQSVFAENYKWDFNDGPPVFTTLDTIQHTFDSAGTYQVKLTAINQEACPATDSITRTIIVQDVPAFNGDSISFCSLQDTISLPALPQGNFAWTWSPSTFLSNSNSPSVIVQAPSSSTVYLATVQSSFGCLKQATYKISNGILKSKAKADTLKGCKPLSIKFSSQSYQAKKIRWYFGDGDSSASLHPDSIQNHVFQNPAIYKVVLKAENDTTCLKAVFDSLYIQVFDLPYFNDTIIRYCEAGPVQLKASRNRGTKFLWSPSANLNDSTFKQPTLSTALSQIYNLTIKDNNQCEARAKVSLRDGRLKASFQLTGGGLCAPVNLNIINTSINAQNSRYIWAGDSTDVTGIQSIPLSATESGIIKVKLKIFSDTACILMDEVTQQISIGGIKPIEAGLYNFCPGNPFVVSALKRPGFTYSWPELASPLVSDSSKATILLGNDSITITIGLKDSFGCPGNQLVKLKPAKPKASFTTISEFEPCFDYLNYTLSAAIIPSASFAWRIDSIGLNGNPIQYRFPKRGQYQVQLIANQSNCKDTINRTIDIQDAPLNLTADFDIEKTLLDCQQLPRIKIVNKSLGADRSIWSWKGNYSFEREPEIRIMEPMVLKINLITYQGFCTKEITKEFNLEPINPPNLITKNGDGLNDVFEIRNLPEGSILEIRNRWGESIYHSDNYKNDWQPPLKFDTGFYDLKLPDGRGCRSWIKVQE